MATVDPDLGHIELYRIAEDGTYGAPERFDRASTSMTPSFAEVSVSMARMFRA